MELVCSQRVARVSVDTIAWLINIADRIRERTLPSFIIDPVSRFPAFLREPVSCALALTLARALHCYPMCYPT